MRLRTFGAVVCGAAIGATALVAQDVPAMFNMKLDLAQGYVASAMHDGRIQWQGYGTPFERAKGQARAALVNTVLTWVKDYTESEPFATRYNNERKRLEPRAPYPKPTADQVLGRQKADLEYRIATEKRRLEMPPPRNFTSEQVETARKATEARLKDFETRYAPLADPKTFSEMRNKLESQAASEKQQYESERAKWEEKYPADYRALIAKQLHRFLSETADVDYGAKLVPCTHDAWRNLQCFANPNYENKSAEWKLCYRTGRQSVDAARAFATAWLGEIEKK